MRDAAADEARQARTEANRGAASAAASAAERAEAHRHEHKWSVFVSTSASALISFEQIPWLPIESEELLCEALGIARHSSDADARKKAHRAASMRWHPDRFAQQFGPRLREEDYERIMQRVTAMSQAINTMVR